jgi:carnosine N-methyltransferase
MPYKKLKTKDKLQWFKYMSEMEDLFNQMNENIDINSGFIEESKERLLLLRKVNTFNKSFYKTIKNELYSLIDKKDLLFTHMNSLPKSFYIAYTFKYLLRDWGINNESSQRSVIVAFLQKKIKELNIRPEKKALFVGCGNGRYAVDLSDHYESIDAFDSSLPMIWSIYHLIGVKNWEVFIKVEKNCKTIKDSIYKDILSISQKQKNIIKNKISFYVADAKKIPLNNESVNHLYSIYFTDALPLKILFDEVNRVLENQGLFIHFGPLDYFFTNVNEMLSAEEIIAFFKKKGYIVLADEFIPTSHLSIINSMRNTEYDNWFFIARKNIKKNISIDLKTKLIPNMEINLTILNSLDNNSFNENEFNVSVGETSFEIPEIVYLIIKKMSFNLSLSETISLLDVKELSSEELKRIVNIFQKLFEYNIVNISK